MMRSVFTNDFSVLKIIKNLMANMVINLNFIVFIKVVCIQSELNCVGLIKPDRTSDRKN